MQFPVEGSGGKCDPEFAIRVGCSFPTEPQAETASHSGREFRDKLSAMRMPGYASATRRAQLLISPLNSQRVRGGGRRRRGNVRAAMPGIAKGVCFPEVAGYIGVTRQRPAQFAVRNSNPAAQGKQTGAHFLGKQLVQNVPLVLRKAVQICQRVHRFAADRDVQNVLRDRL